MNDFKERVIKARESRGEALKIIRDFEPLIKKCIGMYMRDTGRHEDAMQEGRLAVLKCIVNYNLSSPVPFEGYVKMAIIYCIRGFSLKRHEDVSLDEEVSEGGGSLHDFMESDMDIEGDAIKKEEFEKLYAALRELPENQREVIDEVFFEGKTMREVCKGRRCHYMTVVKQKEKALNNLRARMEGCN